MGQSRQGPGPSKEVYSDRLNLPWELAGGRAAPRIRPSDGIHHFIDSKGPSMTCGETRTIADCVRKGNVKVVG